MFSHDACRSGPEMCLMRDSGLVSTGPNLEKSTAGIRASRAAAGRAGRRAARQRRLDVLRVMRPFSPVPLDRVEIDVELARETADGRAGDARRRNLRRPMPAARAAGAGGGGAPAPRGAVAAARRRGVAAGARGLPAPAPAPARRLGASTSDQQRRCPSMTLSPILAHDLARTDPGPRRRHVHRRLVGLQRHQRLVGLDDVAGLDRGSR